MENGDNRRRSEQSIIDGKSIPVVAGVEAGSDAALTASPLGDSADIDPLAQKRLSPPNPPDRRRWLCLCIVVLMSIVMLATMLLVTATRDKKTSLLAAEQARLEESTSGREQVLETWLEGRISASRRLTESAVVRLFVGDLSAHKTGTPMPRSLLDQRPYFQQLLADFVRQHDLVRATVLGRDGRILLNSAGPALLVPDLLDQIRRMPDGWQRLVSPIRQIGDKNAAFVVDAVVPFPAVQAVDRAVTSPSTFLVLTLPISQVLTRILTATADNRTGESIYLLQQRLDQTEELFLDRQGLTKSTIFSQSDALPGKVIAFGRRAEHDGRQVYSEGKPIGDLAWTLVHAVEARFVLAPVHRFTLAATGMSALVVLTLALGFAALWWRRNNRHYRDMTQLHQSFTEQIDRQRRFLTAVTSSISDWLIVSAPDDHILYVNPALANALDQPRERIVGRLKNDVFSPRSILPADDELGGILDDHHYSVIDIDGRRHVVSCSVSDLKDQHGKVTGNVTVARDHTDLVDHRQRRMQAIKQTIDAFIHAVERRDPFLLGHTRRVRRHAIAVARKLGLSPDDQASLALAASLSQIGKIFIPDRILLMEERHSPEEARIMRGHIGHAVGILERIDFELPVVDVLGQMHERLDGSGYPNGRSGDEINLPARILAATDVFCARTAPRSYRTRSSAGAALYQLANNSHRYDIKVIAAIADIVAKQGELDEPDYPEKSFLDAWIWRCGAGDRSRSDLIHRHDEELATAGV